MWYEAYGLRPETFTGVPDDIRLVGHQEEKQRLLEGLTSRKLLCLSGEIGVGKTTLLKYVSRLGSWKYKYIYYDCTPVENHVNFNLKTVLGKKVSFLDRLLRRKVVFLCDETQKLGPAAEDIKAFHESGDIYSVAFCAIDTATIVESMRHRLYEAISLRTLSNEEVATILSNRMEHGTNPFTHAALLRIGELSNQNPRDALRLAEKVLDRFWREKAGKDSITPAEVEAVHATAVTEQQDDGRDLHQAFDKTGFTREENIARLRTRLSPAQWKVVVASATAANPLSYLELSEATGMSPGTVSKMLSRLCLNSNVAYMHKKGFSKPLMKKIVIDGKPRFELKHEYTVLLAEK